MTWVSPIDALLVAHNWDGRRCTCGSDAASLDVWNRHVVVEAWAKFAAIGAEAARRADDGVRWVPYEGSTEVGHWEAS